MRFQRPRERTAAFLVYACFAAGLAISVLMLVRSVTGGDQLNLLARGWLWAARGQLIPYGNPLSTGGKGPGCITTLLVGLPLFVWRDYRAPVVVILLFHAAAFLLLDATLRRVLAPHERLLFAVIYWLNPWRLYLSGFLWNPNYLFLFGAVHLWSCLAQRHRALFWASLLHTAGLVLAFQIHPSFLLLIVASALLWWRKFFKLQWPGAVLGALLGALPLLPWYLEVRAHPVIATAAAGRGFPGRGLLYVFPLVRGVAYWLRYGSLYIADNISAFDFTDVLDSDRWGPWLGGAVMIAVRVLLPVTMVLALVANLRLWRPVRRRFKWWRPAAPETSLKTAGRVWLRGYVVWCFVAAVIVFSAAPTTIMYWQVLPVFHAAVLPMVLWGGLLWRSRRARRVGQSVRAWVALSLVLGVAIAFGSPLYRCNGRQPMRFSLVSHSPMFDELGLQATCPWPLDRPGGWWPDVLPKGGHGSPTSPH